MHISVGFSIFKGLCNHYHNLTWNFLFTPKRLSTKSRFHFHAPHHPSLQQQQSPISTDMPNEANDINGIIHDVVFCSWLLSQSKFYEGLTFCSLYQYFALFYGWGILLISYQIPTKGHEEELSLPCPIFWWETAALKGQVTSPKTNKRLEELALTLAVLLQCWPFDHVINCLA